MSESPVVMANAAPDSSHPPPVPSGKYLYAIVEAAEARRAYELAGINGEAVCAIVEGALAAIVSDVPKRRLRPERRHLAAHQGILRALSEEAALLPMAFGSIANDEEAIRTILRSNQDAFLAQLRRVEGKVEMGLKVVWAVPNIFEYFVGFHAPLRELRDEVFRGGREPSQADKIELGRAFDTALKEERADHLATVADVLRPVCSEIKANEPHEEREVMNLACLIPREAQADFEAAVFEAARQFDNNYSFDYSGPWPPFNFVNGEFQVQD